MSAVVIRRLSKSEGEEWTRLRLRALADDTGSPAQSSWPPRSRSWVEAGLERMRPLARGANEALFVAEEDGQPVGCAAVSIAEDGSATILSMWTAPRHRGRGIATRMLRAIETWAEQRGSHRLVLQVLETNRSAQALYARAGFRRVEEPRAVDGGSDVPVVDMEQTLSRMP